ncbi:MAG: restriction endonuclease [Acidobacteria bacterium]|nr:restriction endonuclease [Acidobacteriota bacterium]
MPQIKPSMNREGKLIDFTELLSAVPGEGLEELVRQIGRRKGLSPAWSGRGADGGRDLFFTESLSGPLSRERIRWLVSCKDKAKSNASVTEKDLPETGVRDKVTQHKANGFLLVTTTTVSTAAKELLDQLDKSNGGDIYTLVWDSSEITAMLLEPSNQDLLKQFLPQSYERLKGLTTLEGAVLAFRDQLPEEVLADVMRLVRPYSDSPLRGLVIWPHDTASATSIDLIIRSLLIDKDTNKAVSVTESIEYEAFVALADKLLEQYPNECYNYLAALVCNHKDTSIIFNSAQILFDNYEIPQSDYIKFATHLDGEALTDLYGGEIMLFIQNTLQHNPSDYETHDSLDVLSSATILDGVSILSLHMESYSSGRIGFYGEMEVDVTLQYGSELTRYAVFPGEFEGYFDEHGMYLISATVDTSSFYE